MRHVSKGRENDKTCQDASDGVDDGYSQGVPVGIEDVFFLYLCVFLSLLRGKIECRRILVHYFRTLLLKEL